MIAAAWSIVGQGIPLAPPLQVRLIALAVIEVVLLITVVLLYIRWAQLKKEPLDEWWEGRKQAGFSARTRALMDEEERERIAAEGTTLPADSHGVAETGLADREPGSGSPS